MIPETPDISRRRGDGGIILTSEKKRYPKKLSKEIMGRLLITAAIALFFFGFLYLTANAIATTYLMENSIVLTEGQRLTLQAWIRSISLFTHMHLHKKTVTNLLYYKKDAIHLSIS